MSLRTASRPVPALVVTVVVTVASSALLAGCGGADDAPTAADPTPSTIVETPLTPSPTVVAPPSVPPSAATTGPTKKPASKPTDGGGNGDSEDDDTPATAGGGICGELEAEEVGAVLGGPVRGTGLPGGGCGFDQADQDAPDATFLDRSSAEFPGGLAAAKQEATSTVEGTPVDVAGVGDGAFVVTGGAFGGTEVQGAGAVLIGDRIIAVNLTQSAGLKRARVKALVLDLLKLAVAEAS